MLELGEEAEEEKELANRHVLSGAFLKAGPPSPPPRGKTAQPSTVARLTGTPPELPELKRGWGSGLDCVSGVFFLTSAGG